MIWQVGDIEAVAGKRQVVGLYKRPILEFVAHQNVAADRNALARDDGFNSV
jgi:hypothetical protein